MKDTMKALTLCIILLGFVRTAHAEVAPPIVEGFRTATKQSPYEVQGNSIQTLVAEMKAKGPLDEGKRFFGKTHWDLRWNYRYEQKEGGFVITTLMVMADIQYQMPRRILPPDEADNVAPQWARFMAALTTHENGHGQNAIQHGKTLYAILRAHRVFASAQELKNFVKTEGDKCIADANATDVEYDRKTEHGATQGATLR